MTQDKTPDRERRVITFTPAPPDAVPNFPLLPVGTPFTDSDGRKWKVLEARVVEEKEPHKYSFDPIRDHRYEWHFLMEAAD
jgi:hypothetical protein